MNIDILHKWARFVAPAALACLAIVGVRVQAEEAKPTSQGILAVPLLPGEVVRVTGKLDDPAWQRAPVYSSFLETEPVNGAAPKYETRVQVLFSKDAVFVGVTALDPAPASIREELVRHDLVRRTQDFVAVYLDPVGHRTSAQLFRVGAGGSTTDGVHTAEDDNEDLSPDFDWDSAVDRNASGYSVVFRIPFASLRYTGSGRGPWRIMITRRVPRDQVYLLTSAPVPANSQSIVSEMQLLEGIEIPKDDGFLTIRPTLTFRNERATAADQPDSRKSALEASLDVKWRPIPALVVDATIHPDFSQVELDVPQLSGNTSFALFYPEKRPFFLEGSDLLRSPLSALSTRSVTLPSWGIRGTLRTDALSGTAFISRDRGTGVVLLPNPYGTRYALQPASYVAATRFRSDSDTLSIGGIASMRLFDNDLGDNIVVGPDATWQVTDSLRLRGQWLLSSTSALTDADGALHRGVSQMGHESYLNAFWRIDGYEVNLTLDDSSSGFRDDNGFINQVGVTKYDAIFSRLFYNVGPVNELKFSLQSELIKEKSSNITVSGYLVPGVYAKYGSNSEATIEYRGVIGSRLQADGPFLRERYWHLEYARNLAAWFPQISIMLDSGKLTDALAGTVRPGSRVSLLGKLRLGKRLEVELSGSEARLSDSDVNVYTETAAQLLAIWHLGAGQSLRLISQRTSLDRRAEPAIGVEAARERGRADSLTYAWRRSAGNILYLGATRANNGSTSSTEIFVKLQFDVSDAISFR